MSPRSKIDPDSLPMSDEFLAGFRRVREVAPELVDLQHKMQRGRPKLAEPKVALKLRLSQRVIQYFRATGPGWQTRINATLEEAIDKQEDPTDKSRRKVAHKRA